MALTAVADTRLLLTLQFPSSREIGKRVEEAISRELAGRLLAPSIVLTEFVQIAGARIGESPALLRLNLLKERGMRVFRSAKSWHSPPLGYCYHIQTSLSQTHSLHLS